MIPIFSIYLSDDKDLSLAQAAYGQFVFEANSRKLFLEGLLLEISLIHTDDKLVALKNTMILKRTIPCLIPSIAIRMDKEDGKILFEMNFLKKTSLPWILGFTYPTVPSIQDIERSAYSVSGIDA